MKIMELSFQTTLAELPAINIPANICQTLLSGYVSLVHGAKMYLAELRRAMLKLELETE